MKLIIGIIITGFLLLACDQATEQHQSLAKNPMSPSNTQIKAPIKGAIAKVGDHFFTEADINAEFLRMPDSVKKLQQQKAMRTNLLKNIMTRYTLVQQAKKDSLDEDPIIKSRIDSIISSVLIQALNEKMRLQLNPSEDDLRLYYNEHQGQYQQAPQWHIRHILLKDENKAKEVLKSLQKGGDFATLAASTSQDPVSRQRGGDLKPFNRGQMGPVIEQALQRLNAKNPLSGIVHSHLGYHIIQWIETLPVRTRAFEDVKVQLTTQLQQQRFREWVEQLKKDANYEIIKPDYR